MDLFLREAADRIGADDVLTKIDTLMDWRAFTPILKRGLGRSGEGPPGYDPLVLFKCLLIGQWHGLSDPKLERALKVRLFGHSLGPMAFMASLHDLLRA